MNLDKMCRICGKSCTDDFETVQDHEEHIYKYLPIKDDNFGYPNNICKECVSSIGNWNSFYNRCAKTQNKFALMLEKKKHRLGSNNESHTAITLVKELNNGQSDTVENEKADKESDSSFSCNFCAVPNKSQQQLNDHLIALHCDMVFCCDLCKNYKPRNDLITHMTEHALSSLQLPTPVVKPSTTLDKFKCPECDKQFVSNSGLKYHMNSSHTAEQQFPCNECEHIFSCKRVLLNHFRSVHSKDKQFKCNDCEKSFKSDSTLYAHRKTHSDDTPYKCFDCGKGFKFKHHLGVHSAQHKKKEKTFNCSCCHKKFAALNNLTKHRKIHDKTTDFACHICGVKLTQKRYLRDHMRRVHRTRLDSLEAA